MRKPNALKAGKRENIKNPKKTIQFFNSCKLEKIYWCLIFTISCSFTAGQSGGLKEEAEAENVN